MAALSISASLGIGLAASLNAVICETLQSARADAICGKAAKESHNLVRSLGRAERSATRVRMRSISPTCFSWTCNVSCR